MASVEIVIRDRAKEITLPATGIRPRVGFIDSAMVPWVSLGVIIGLNEAVRVIDSCAWPKFHGLGSCSTSADRFIFKKDV